MAGTGQRAGTGALERGLGSVGGLEGARRTLSLLRPRLWLENTRPSRSHPESERKRLEPLPQFAGYRVDLTDSGDFLCLPTLTDPC